MNKYKEWDLLDSLPRGWVIDKTCGSPLHGYDFITNGKSAVAGQKRALLMVLPPQQKFAFNAENTQKRDAPKQEAERQQEQVIDAHYVRTVNDLARKKFKEKLLNDIMVDLMICEIEGWPKIEYIDEIKELINGIGATA